MECRICQMISGKEKSFKIFEDDKTVAVLAEKPCTQGHIMLFSKEHHPIIEGVSDSLIGHMFNVANKLSTKVFEKLNAQGTNILINNGVVAGQDIPHFAINIIPRWQNDGLGMEWTPKRLSEEEMTASALLIGEKAKGIGIVKEAKKEIIEEKPEDTEKIPSKNDEGEENYQIKQLDRLP